MAQTRRRYIASDGTNYIVTVSWDERRLDKAHWFEAQDRGHRSEQWLQVSVPARDCHVSHRRNRASVSRLRQN
jgi:hypothetical protein